MANFTITVSNSSSTQSPAGVINQGDQLTFAVDPKGGPATIFFKNAKSSPFASTTVAVPSSAPVTSPRSGSFDFDSAEKGGTKLGTVVIELSITVSGGLTSSPSPLATVNGQKVKWLQGTGGPTAVQFPSSSAFGSKDIKMGQSYTASSVGKAVYSWSDGGAALGVGSGTVDVGTGP